MKKGILNGQAILTYMIFALLFTACVWATIHALKPVNTEDYQVITVHTGDTIWGIAKNYEDELNPSSFIKWVENVNNIQSDHIKAGDQIVIPIKKGQESDHSHYTLASK